MGEKAGPARIALLAVALALGVSAAGCTVQDRPHNEAFFVVADAGEARVLQAGSTAHLVFPENLSLAAEEGEPPHEPVEYAWKSSWGPTGEDFEFHAAPPAPGLSIVELNVTAKNHTASDAVGLLVVPGGSAGTGRTQIGLLGEADLDNLPGSPALTKDEVRAGGHEGGDYWAPIPASGPARYALVPWAGASAPEAVLLIAVKASATALYTNASLPLAFGAGQNYTLVVDATAAQQHRIEVQDSAGALVESLSLEAFASAHPGEAEARVLVAPPAQVLPGFEAAAVAGALVGAAILAVARKR